MKNSLLKGNIYIILFYRIFIVMSLFSLCRIGFYIFNINMFPGISFKQFITILRGGLLFDISAIIYFNLLFIILTIIPFDFRYKTGYQTTLRYLFFVTNGFALVINCADSIYYRFVLKRATFEIFKTFENESNIPKLIFRFMIDYWPMTLFGLVILFLLIYFYNKIRVEKPNPVNRLLYYSVNVLLIPLILALAVIGARGGYRHSTRPITISNAVRYTTSPRNVAIVLNTPFSLLRTSGNVTLNRYNFFDDEKLRELYNPHYIPTKTKPFSNDNVVIIILESFGSEYIGALNTNIEGGTYKGYTPFIDSLINESLTFDISLANGNKSIEAMPSILASIPSLVTPYPISNYANNEINGLATLLKQKGYYTSFFHGAPNGSMGFDSFSRLSGFDEYFGLNQYPEKKDFDRMWGVWDEPFLNFFAEKINSFREPFLTSVFTVSSHHPFKVPEKYKDKFEKGPVSIVEVIGYTDFALKEFFREASKSSWFKNTLFVITADHTNEAFHEEYQNDFGSYRVPIIFFKQGSDLKGKKNKIAQQLDIMPTVLNYLNYDKEYIAFGNDLFNDSIESFAFNTTDKNYHLYMRDHLLEMINNQPVGLYNFRTDKLLKTNLINNNLEVEKLMVDKLSAIIQSYNNRLLDNDMVVKNPQ